MGTLLRSICIVAVVVKNSKLRIRKEEKVRNKLKVGKSCEASGCSLYLKASGMVEKK